MRRNHLPARAARALLIGAIVLSGSVVAVRPFAAPSPIAVESEQRVMLPELALPGAGEVSRTTDVTRLSLHAVSALGARWEQELPDGASFSLAIRQGNGAWRDLAVDHDVTADRDDSFEHLGEEHSHEAVAGTAYSEVIVGTDASVQLRATLRSAESAARISDVTLLAYGSAGAFPADGQTAHAADGVRIISRSEWGADETLRMFNPNNPVPEVQKKGELDPEVIEKLGDEIAIVKTVDEDADGNPYTWPMETAKRIEKIVIHHTSSATPQTPDEAVAYLRSVYFFHAVTRGWGDIGYNYIVDPFGNIYEGRAGGKRVVGAHAANYNIGSIGISVMGNYSGSDISPEAKRSVVALVHQLAKEEGIDPMGTGEFRLREMPNILGHRDVGSTDCPGDFLWTTLASIRSLAAQESVDPADPRWTPTLGPAVIEPSTTAIEALLPEIPERFDGSRIEVLEKKLDRLDAAAATLRGSAIALRPAPSNPHSVTVRPGESMQLQLQFLNEGTMDLTDSATLVSDFISPKLQLGNATMSDRTVARLPSGTTVTPGDVAVFSLPLVLDRGARGAFLVQLTPTIDGTTELPAAAVRFEVVVDPSTLGLVDALAMSAVDGGRMLLAGLTGVSPQRLAFAPRLIAGADVEGTPVGRLAALDAEASDEATAPLSTRFTLGMLPEAPGGVVSKNPMADEGEPLRVLLRKAPDKELTTLASSSATIFVDGVAVATIPAATDIVVGARRNTVRVVYGDERVDGSVVRVVPSEGGITAIPTWTDDATQHRFRGVMEFRAERNKLLAINEIDIEKYLRGLAEPSPKDPAAKIEALIIAARTYARYYRDVDEKFPGAPYHLDDDPARSQKYIGVAFEERAPEVVAAVVATRGMVVTYNDTLVKTPYFSASEGQTRSAEEAWGWTDTPYLTSVADPCDAPRAAGHGVGLSGCGARVLAQRGKSAREILAYFYPGTTIARAPSAS